MAIWNQGDYYKDLGESTVTFHHRIAPGPSDELIQIHGFNVLPDENGHFVQSEDGNKYTDDEMDAIRTFAISRRLILILEEIMEKPIQWQWVLNGSNDPLQIYIRNSGINSRYLRSHKCIELDYYGPYKNWTYYCRSVDIVAHETGHAILDGLKPNWYDADMETRGIAEAFCDFCALLLVTTNMDLCREVIRETKGDYKKTSMLSLFGAGYGFDDNPHSCIRNAINTIRFDPGFSTVYDYGELLIGFLYDVLTDKSMKEASVDKGSAMSLFEAAIPWAQAIVTSILSCNDEKTTIREFLFHFQNDFCNDEIVKKSLKARKLL
jgi:hypothetical protein